MTFRFNPRHLVLCLSLSVFFSCKKDDNPAPTPPPAEPTLFEQVQGRWNAEIDRPDRNSNLSAKEQGMSKVVVIEFFSDSTYIIAFNGQYSGNSVSGKFKPVDSVNINLSGPDITSISDVKISEDSISFSYSAYDDVIAVKAAKADNLTISEDKKPLLKSWLVERDQEDGELLYQQYGIEEGHKINFFFSAAGTFLAKFEKGQNEIFQFTNWKWHSQVANAALVYSIYGEQLYDSYYKVISISNTSLTVEEVSQQTSGTGTTSRTFVLTAQ